MMNIPNHFFGGCACGAIRYESTAAPVMMLHCHCRDCQRSSGGPFSSFIVVPKDAFRLIQGSPQVYGSPSDAGGETERGFCRGCGSPILANPSAVPHLVAVRAATLDDASWFQPQAEIWTCDAQREDYINPNLPRFEKYPK